MNVRTADLASIPREDADTEHAVLPDAVVAYDLRIDPREEIAEPDDLFDLAVGLAHIQPAAPDLVFVRVIGKPVLFRPDRNGIPLCLTDDSFPHVGVVHPVQLCDQFGVGDFLRRLFVFHDRFDGVLLAEVLQVKEGSNLRPCDVPSCGFACIRLICHFDSFPTLRSCLMFRFAYRLFSATIVITILSAAGLDLYFEFCKTDLTGTVISRHRKRKRLPLS